MTKVALIVSSTRPTRVGLDIAKWLKPVLESAGPELNFTQVDLADFKLPVFDEVVAPAMVPQLAQYTKEHAKKWSAEIKQYDAYVLLANEYNGAVSGSTKNAIDYLYNEWIGKPIMIVTYGIFGGTETSAQLQKILTLMKLRVCETKPTLAFHGGQQGPDLYDAIKGVLGEASQKAWAEEKSADIKKGVDEIVKFIKEPQPEPTPAGA